jgi:hypothetical protein
MYFIYSGIIADYTKENKQIDTEQQTKKDDLIKLSTRHAKKKSMNIKDY